MNIIQRGAISPNGEPISIGRYGILRSFDKYENMEAIPRMATMVQHPILLKSGDLIGEGILHSQAFDLRERKIRAAKILGLMWLFAALSLPIIIAHFVLVPGFLIAGPVMAYKRYRVTEVPDHVSGNCPAGKEDFTLALEASDRLPMWRHCPSCSASLYLMDKEGASAV